MIYIRLKQDVTLEQLGVTVSTQNQNSLATEKAKDRFISYYNPPRELTQPSAPHNRVNCSLGRIDGTFFEEVYKYYHITDHDTQTFLDVAHVNITNSSYNIRLNNKRYSLHRHSVVTEFTNEEYLNYIPTLKNYQFKSLNESDLDTTITASMEYLLDSTALLLIEEEIKVNDVIHYEGHKIYSSDLIEFISDEVSDTRNPPILWSSTRTRNLNIDTDYVKDQLRVRYAFFERPRSGLSNVVLDSFMPRLMYLSSLNVSQLNHYLDIPKTAVTISPWFASILGIKQIPIEQLIRILGYSEKDIKKLFQQVRKKRFTLNMIGFGGTAINTLHWLNEMSMLTNSINLFKSINIWEPDSVEISNLLRFPINPMANTTSYYENTQSVNKTDLINGELTRLSQNKSEIFQSYFEPSSYNSPYSFTRYDEFGSRIPTSNMTYTLRDKSNVMYGAPNIATREVLGPLGNFISATHADSNCRIDLNPAQNTDLQVESYGMISLAAFFMNQLRMTIGLLELLASDQDLQEQDKTILEYQFSGKRLLPTDREYNFQLEHSGLVLTPEEAANV